MGESWFIYFREHGTTAETRPSGRARHRKALPAWARDCETRSWPGAPAAAVPAEGAPYATHEISVTARASCSAVRALRQHGLPLMAFFDNHVGAVVVRRARRQAGRSLHFRQYAAWRPGNDALGDAAADSCTTAC